MSNISGANRTVEDLALVIAAIRATADDAMHRTIAQYFGYDAKSLRVISKLKNHLMYRFTCVDEFNDHFTLLSKLVEKNEAEIDSIAQEIEAASLAEGDIDQIFRKHTGLAKVSSADCSREDVRIVNDGLEGVIAQRLAEFASKPEKKVIAGCGHAMSPYYLNITRGISHCWANDWLMVDVDPKCRPDILGGIDESLKHLGKLDILYYEGFTHHNPTEAASCLNDGGLWIHGFMIEPDETHDSLMEKFPGFSQVILIANFGSFVIPPSIELRFKSNNSRFRFDGWLKFESKETIKKVFEYNALSFPVGGSTTQLTYIFSLAIK